MPRIGEREAPAWPVVTRRRSRPAVVLVGAVVAVIAVGALAAVGDAVDVCCEWMAG